MLQAKAMLVRRTSRQQILGATRAWNYGDRLFTGIGRYSMDELLRFPNLLRMADRSLKGGALSGQAVLEELVDRMTGPAGPTVG